MCGRVLAHIDIPTIRRISRVQASRRSKKSRRGYNIGPGSIQAAIIHSTHKSRIPASNKPKVAKPNEETKLNLNERVLTSFKWGIDSKGKTSEKSKILHFNLRIENVQGLFKRLLEKRCVMVIDGYYEWTDSQPYLVKPKKTEVIFLACLFDFNGEIGESAILTCEAPEWMSWMHHRAPCVLNEEDLDQWIDPNVGFEKAAELLKPPTDVEFEIMKVPKIVNSMKNDSSDCIMRYEDYAEKVKSQGISKFFVKVEKRKDNDESLFGKEMKHK